MPEFTPPVAGDKPAAGRATSTPPGQGGKGGSGQGGTQPPVAGGVPATAPAADIPGAFLPDRGVRESITFGQGTGDNDKHRAR